MTDLTAFNFHGASVRTLTDEHGEPWFVLTDLCAVLGIANPRNVAARLDNDVMNTVRLTDGKRGNPNVTAVNEAGMYDVVTRSESPQSRPFRRWVTHEVLPSIRRTGSYSTTPELTGPELMAKALIEAQATLEAKDEQIAALEPPARAWNTLASSAGDYSLRDAAQILARDHGIITGQNRLMDTLRAWFWVDAKDIPYQRVVDQGLLRQRPRSYEHPRTNVRALAKPQIRVTTKGIERILHRIQEAS